MTIRERPSGGRPAIRSPLPASFSVPGLRHGSPDHTHPAGHEGHPGHHGNDIGHAVVDCALYVAGCRRDGAVPLASALHEAKQANGFVWVGLHEPDAPTLHRVAEQFGLHPLAVEDASSAHNRPKLETYARTLFMVLKTVRYIDHHELIETGELMVFVGSDFVVTVRYGEAGELAGVRKDLEDRPDLLGIGPAAVLYAVVDRVVDGYLPAAEAVENDVDEIENQVFALDQRQPTERIYKLKREVMEFRRAVDPLIAATSRLAEGRLPCLDDRTEPYFRDVNDHVVRASEHVAAMDELLNSALSSNLAQVSVRQNEDMRKISAWVAIAAVCTLVAGVYGMNFHHMPELSWTYGYPYALGLMLTFSVLLWRGFRRNNWL